MNFVHFDLFFGYTSMKHRIIHGYMALHNAQVHSTYKNRKMGSLNRRQKDTHEDVGQQQLEEERRIEKNACFFYIESFFQQEKHFGRMPIKRIK